MESILKDLPTKNKTTNSFSYLWGALKTFRKRKRLNWIISAFAIVFLPFIYQCFIEFVLQRSFFWTLEYLWLRRWSLLPGYIVLLLLFTAISFITTRPWAASLVTGGVLFVASYANYYKQLYRAEPVMPKDIVQISEAVNIQGSLDMPFTRELWAFLVFGIIVTLLMVPVQLPLSKGWKNAALRLVGGSCGAILAYAMVFGYMADVKRMEEKHNFVVEMGNMGKSYYYGTFVTSFLSLTSRLEQPAPENYSKQEMQSLAALLPQTSPDAKTPDIIVVLLESFFDIGKLDGITYSQPLMLNYDRLAQEGIAGTMLPPKRGGGTANAEFSVLSGFALDHLPEGSMPYLEYIFQDYPALPLYYKSNGYTTIAMHTYHKNFYSRSSTYNAMKFDEAYFSEDMPDATIAGEYIGDDYLADSIIKKYEEKAIGSEHIFFHAVSMQNHTPYPPDRYPDGYNVVVANSGGYGDEMDGVLSTLATGIRDTDDMIGKLCDYFADVDRDVVLVFFGDHQSAITPVYDVPDLVSMIPQNPKRTEGEAYLDYYGTPYLIWANFEKKSEEGSILASWQLMPTMVESYNVAGPPWFSWISQQQKENGGFSNNWYFTADGTFSTQPTEAQQVMFTQHQLFQYDLMFGKQYIQNQMLGSFSS